MISNNSKRPRLLVIQQLFYPDISAVSQLLTELLGALSGPYDITVLCTTAYNDLGQGKAAPDEVGGVKIKRVKVFKLGKANLARRVLENLRFYLSTLFHVLFSADYDLIVAMTSPPFIGYAAALGNLPHKKRPLIHYVEDVFPELLFDIGMIRAPWYVRRLAHFSRFAYRHSEGIITIGSYMRRKLAWNYGIPESEIRVVENWVSDVEYAEPKDFTSGLNLLYSGNAGMAHDFSLLDELVLFFASNERIRLTFVGGGHQYAELRDQYKTVLGDRADFFGYVDKERHGEVLSSGHVMIISQREDTVGDILPSKLYSYLAAGRPLLFLGPANSEIGELIKAEGVGAVLESRDQLEPAIEWLDSLLSNYSAYKGLCRRIRKLFEDRYTLTRAVMQFDQVVREVLP